MQTIKTSIKTPEDMLKAVIGEKWLSDLELSPNFLEDFCKKISKENNISEGLFNLKKIKIKNNSDNTIRIDLRPTDLFSGFIYYSGLVVPVSVLEGLEEFTVFYEKEITVRMINGAAYLKS